MTDDIKLTQFSHGAGCGCKISPQLLQEIIGVDVFRHQYPNLLVGAEKCDDAAVYALDDKSALISTTDFFMPIVDDPFDFGRIAAANAISDIYAMGGKPLMAIAILGWPINTLSTAVAHLVVNGGRATCFEANIPLAGGHSIDSPEPIFGLAVTGIIEREFLTLNSTAQLGDVLFLTKPLGVGILTTAEKKGKLQPQDGHIAKESMCILNSIGMKVARLPGIHAMTDVTGFGLLGHLIEMCEGSGVGAELKFAHIPVLNNTFHYINDNCLPGGTHRNFSSYGHKIAPLTTVQRSLLCDPQTSGGLLIAVAAQDAPLLARELEQARCCYLPIGKIVPRSSESLVSVL
jgi:selenide,water dikinase